MPPSDRLQHCVKSPMSVRQRAYLLPCSLSEAVKKDGVICLECGLIFKSLPQHLWKHQLSSREYKAKWGYNQSTSLQGLSTFRKKRRNALAMNFGASTPPSALQKALKVRRGSALPYRPERRLAATEAARARVAANFRRTRLKLRKLFGRELKKNSTHLPIRTQRRGSRFEPSKSDLKILSLRKKGLWLGEIAKVLEMKVRSVEHRLRRLKEEGFTIPSQGKCL